MRRIGFYLTICATLAVILGGCGPRTLSEDRGQALLSDIRNAQRSVSISGQLHTTIRLGTELVSAEAKVHRGEGRMQLEFTSGRAKGARIVQQKNTVWQISPDGKTVRRLPHNPVDTMPHPGRNVKITTQRGGQIAGRGTKKVVVSPKREAGGRLEMWMDRRTDFPLRMDRYNSRGKLVSSTRYKKVDFSAPPPEIAKLSEDAQSPARGVTRIETDKAAEILGQEPVKPKYIPEGFEFRGYYLHTTPRRKAVVLRYSDGLHPLNILQMQLPEGRGRGEGRTGERRARTDAPPQQAGPGGPERAGPRSGRGRQGLSQTDRDSPRRPSPAGQPPQMDRERDPQEGPHVLQHRVLGRIIRFERGDLLIVVQGELPAEQLRRIAAGLQESNMSF